VEKRPCGYDESSLMADLPFLNLFFPIHFHPISFIPLVENDALIDALNQGKVS
jgi:hypothetical protein